MEQIVTPSVVAVSKLAAYGNAYEVTVWPGFVRPVTRKEVGQAVAQGKLLEPDSRPTSRLKRWEHVRRIAWLVANGWSNPIEIDVGVPSLGFHC